MRKVTTKIDNRNKESIWQPIDNKNKRLVGFYCQLCHRRVRCDEGGGEESKIFDYFCPTCGAKIIGIDLEDV